MPTWRACRTRRRRDVTNGCRISPTGGQVRRLSAGSVATAQLTGRNDSAADDPGGCWSLMPTWRATPWRWPRPPARGHRRASGPVLDHFVAVSLRSGWSRFHVAVLPCGSRNAGLPPEVPLLPPSDRRCRLGRRLRSSLLTATQRPRNGHTGRISADAVTCARISSWSSLGTGGLASA